VETPKFVKERAEKKAKHLSRDPQLDKRMQMARDLMVAAPLIGQIGSPTPQHVAHASKLLQELNASIKTSAREPFGARAVVYAMLLDRDQTMRDTQMQALKTSADSQVFALTQKLTEPAFALDPAVRLPVIDLAMPALRSLSPAQYQAFRDNVNVLIKADKKVELFEWVLRKILLRHLESHFSEVRRPVVQYYNLHGVKDACATLLSVLAYVGHADKEAALAAFKLGARTMQLEDIAPKPPADCSLDHLDNVLNELNSLAPRAKQPVIQGAATCIASDHEVTTAEVELLRAICDTLDCPMPPLLPGQPLV